MFTKKHSFLFMLVLTALSIVTGGGAMAAVTIGEEGPDPINAANTTDPVDPNANDLKSPGGKQDGQDLTGTQMSSSQLERGGMIEDEWDDEITKFFPHKTPLLSIARQVSKKVPVQNWTIKHMRVGGETLDGETTADIAAGDTVKITSNNFSGNLRPFYKGSTVFACGVPGYKKGSQSVVDGELMLFVTSTDDTGATMMAINGPAKVEGETSDSLSDMTCPAIPAGTVLLCGATAASESQLMSPPENYQPRSKDVNVQKKLLNIVFTEDYEKVKKKQPLKVRDVKEDAVIKYNLRAERSYWKGVKSRFLTRNEDGSEEFVYTADGILRQLTNFYALDNKPTKADLIALAKLQFTEFSENDQAYAFCGRNAIERLESINLDGDGFTKVLTDFKNLDLTFKRFSDTFGTIDFIYDQTLDLLGMEDAMVIMDLKGARRYVKIGQTEKEVDMSQGSGVIRDAKRYIHYEADAIALRGYNSILVLPKGKMEGYMQNDIVNAIVSSSTLPATPASGDKIALTADFVLNGTTYEAGNVYQWDGTQWVKYNGIDTAN